jgi:hypothetical protein
LVVFHTNASCDVQDRIQLCFCVHIDRVSTYPPSNIPTIKSTEGGTL